MALGIAYNARRVENPLKVPRRIQDRSTGHLCSLLENHCNALAGDVRMKMATVHRKTRHSTSRFWGEKPNTSSKKSLKDSGTVTILKVLYLLQHLQPVLWVGDSLTYRPYPYCLCMWGFLHFRYILLEARFWGGIRLHSINVYMLPFLQKLTYGKRTIVFKSVLGGDMFCSLEGITNKHANRPLNICWVLYI